jgi:hypothetical protein
VASVAEIEAAKEQIFASEQTRLRKKIVGLGASEALADQIVSLPEIVSLCRGAAIMGAMHKR